MLSIIIPAYNEEENIRNTTQVIHDIVTQNKIESELLFIDDGSSDKTWDIICEVSREYSFVRGIRFSRNFGKEGAIFAGLRACKGDCAVMMDCDLQHPPELMPQMYRLWEQGFEVVEAVKASRGKESLIYKMFAKTFYRILRSSSQINLDRASDYKLLDRKVVDALNQLPERLTFFRALSSWVGFRTTQVEFNVLPRAAGTTKWSFRKLYKFAINSITSFTNLPMQIVTFLGVLFAVFSLVLGIQTLINFFMGQAVAGFSTVILLLLIIGSVLMLGIGILGYYVSKIYEEIKFRPRYIVSEEVGEKTDTLEKKEN